MTERYRAAFDTLVDRAPQPPAWEEISQPSVVSVRGPIGGPRRAVLAGLVLVVAFAALAWLVRGVGGAETATTSIDLVEFTWSQEVTVVCEGGEIIDNEGSDSATIRMYGPSPDNFWRIESDFPDGSSVVFVYEGSTRFAFRAWQDPAPIEFEYGSAFRDVACSYPTAEGTAQFSQTSPPVDSFGLLLAEFANPGTFRVSRQETDLVASLAEDPSVAASQGTWRSMPVTVFTRESESLDDLGRRDFSSYEQWVDVDAERVERVLREADHEGLGSSTSELSVTRRSTVAFDAALFDPKGMQLVMDTTGRDIEDAEPVAVTTSIPPLATPLMASAESVELADIPDADLAEAQDGDMFYLVPDSGFVFVRLRIGEPPLLFATSCSDLTSVDLLDGWIGLCSERTLNGEVGVGRFSYEDAATN